LTSAASKTIITGKMKGKFGKAGLLSLALVLALGAGFAYWTGMLSIASTVKASDPGVEFSNQMSNDSATALEDLSTGDPAEWGTWTHPDLNAPSGWTWSGNVQPGEMEVASIDCSITSNLLTATITNGYPGYIGGTAFTLHNTGTVQIEIDSIKLVEVSKGTNIITLSPPVDLVACTTVYVDAETGTASTTPNPATDDFSLHLGVGLAAGQLIGAGDTVFGDIGVRVEPGAKELTSYDFTIEIAFSD